MEDHKSYVLVNITEQLVRKRVRELMPEMKMCQCEKCFLDTCALILNQLPCHYVTTLKGELLTRLDASGLQSNVDLTVYVLQALKKVGEMPHH